MKRMSKKILPARNKVRRPEAPLRDDEQDDAENDMEESQEAMIPEQKLPPGNLWTRIIDLENLASNNALAYSFDEDKESFKYDGKYHRSSFEDIQKIYFDPDDIGGARDQTGHGC